MAAGDPEDVQALAAEAARLLRAVLAALPPPPTDPRERSLAARVEGAALALDTLAQDR